MGLEAVVLGLLGELDPVIVMILIALLPFGECRAAIVYGAVMGINPFVVFFGSLFANILVVPVILLFLQQAHFMRFVKWMLGKRLARKIEKNRKKFEVYEELALFGFVAVPLPGTGAWTGALFASVLGLDRKKSFAVIAFGVVASAIIVSFVTYGLGEVFAYLG
ncbi:MAG: small multi-drug export protein [archaeon]